MRRVALLIPLLLLTACAATTPPPVRAPELPFATPAQWTTAGGPAEGSVRAEWWRDFEDERLAELVGLALERNPGLAVAEARVRAALAAADIVSADLSPQLSASGSGGRSRAYTGGVGPFPDTAKASSFGVALNLAWEADLWGRIRAGAEASLADLGAVEALHRGARLSLAAQTVKAYFALVEASGQLAVAEANLASAKGLRGRIGDRFDEGLRTALDVELAKSEVSTARAETAGRRRVLDAARRQLEILTGGYPEGRVTAAAELPADPGPPPAGVPAEVLSRRPDLEAAERDLAAASARVREARASLYPSLSLTGSRGLASAQLADVLTGDFAVWSLVAGLSAPLFTGGRLQANIRVREAGEEEAVAAFANVALGAFREVETALAADRYLAEQAAATAALVSDARTGLVLSEERYLAGLTDIITVLSARRRHFTARQELLRIHGVRLATRVDLYVALGGGFEPDRVIPAEEL